MNNITKSLIVFSPETKEIITGMLLSDANLNFCNSRAKNARLRFHQKDKLFIDHLYLKMSINNLVGSKPYLAKQIDKKYNKVRESYKFNTLAFPYFTDIYSSWYTIINNRNVKIVPNNISDLLTPRAIAYWIMGDGSYMKDSGRISFSTDSFTLKEVELLRDILLTKYNIASYIYSNGMKEDQFIIRISRTNSRDLAMIVYPYLPDFMLYKVGL